MLPTRIVQQPITFRLLLSVDGSGLQPPTWLKVEAQISPRQLLHANCHVIVATKGKYVHQELTDAQGRASCGKNESGGQ